MSRTDVECVWKRVKTPKTDQTGAKECLDDTFAADVNVVAWLELFD